MEEGNTDNSKELMVEAPLIAVIPVSSIVGLNSICRLCANPNERIIGIYSEEGISNNLSGKMNLYLPVKVSENDTLPLQCCWSCASTVLAWHELVMASVEADRRLRDMEVRDKPICNEDDFSGIDEPVSPDNRSESKSPAASLNVFCQESANTTVPLKRTRSATGDNMSPSYSYNQQFQEVKKEEWIQCDVITEESLQTYIDTIHHPFVSSKPCEDDVLFSVKKEENKNVPLKKSNRKRKKIKDKRHSNTTIRTRNKDCKNEDDNDNKPDYSFSCQYCSMMFVNEHDIISHVKEEHADKKHELDDDDDDDDIFADNKPLSKKDRRRNTKLDHSAVNAAKVIVEGRVYYNCKICSKSLHSPYTYIWHMRIHTGERPFVCDLCGKQFRVSQGLVRHLRETHEGIKNFGCDICGRMFATRRNVEEHRRIHTNERPYICDLCGKSFKQKASLFVHNRSHTDTFPFRCSYCNQGFRTRPPLLIHVTRHTGEKPYPCDVCGRCFRIKYELKRHKLIHSEEKPFSCTECGLSFRQKRYLRNHNKINHSRTTTTA